MLKRVIFLIPVLLLLFTLLPFAVLSQITAPKYSNEFLNLGIGGRALGMGNVQVGIADDANAGYWNPAGLLQVKNKYNLALMHSELFAGIVKNDFAAFALPLDTNSILGFSLIRSGVDDIADTRRLKNHEYGYYQYDSIRFFSVADYAFLISYARRSNLIKGLRVGANAKIIYRNVGVFATAWGFGLDAGAQLQRQNWQFGFMARDITTTFNAWSHNPDEMKYTQLLVDSTAGLPKNTIEITLPRLILGVARTIPLPKNLLLLLAADLDFTFDGKRNVLLKTNLFSLDPKVAFELSYNRLVFLRAGINNLQQIKEFNGQETWQFQPNFGVGVATNGLKLDLALSKIADNANVSSIMVSLGYAFD
ncbi:putative type IX sorting system protein PorV2 [Adhaeribacter radiodurans]|uniref:PorV/PorQ family protein n=1 Tax=Adhaeribacter radiodurans TaxID=2745197 RepID=A0A7L7L6C7_9BACT|nr:PorV/PorQ family protein [Adhaeribacter radiodurans]QMU27919.1 PorV/PorQ family protein [Adhaeribacter radiodurans]